MVPNIVLKVMLVLKPDPTATSFRMLSLSEMVFAEANGPTDKRRKRLKAMISFFMLKKSFGNQKAVLRLAIQ